MNSATLLPTSKRPQALLPALAIGAVLALGASLTPLAHAQTTAYTVPVGFIKAVIPAGGSVSAPISVAIGAPLQQTPTAAGKIKAGGVGTNTLQAEMATWTDDQFVSAAAPQLIRITQGSGEGRFFLITDNVSDQVTVDLGSLSTLVGTVAAGDLFEIFPAWTFKKLFGSTSTDVKFLGNASVNNADNIFIWDRSVSPARWTQYWFTGTIWRRVGAGDVGNDIIFPDEGMFITRRGSTQIELFNLGAVPASDLISEIPGSGAVFIPNRFPVDSTINALGFQNLPNWVKNSSINSADQLFLWNPSLNPPRWVQYWHTGSIWRKVGAGDSGADPVPVGSSIFVKMIGTTPADELAQTIPYNLNQP